MMKSELQNNQSQQQREEDQEQYIDQSASILFSSLDNNNMKTVSLVPGTLENKHIWIHDGLNFSGKCGNEKCNVFNKNVWSKRGYGTFFINQQKFKVKCPMCQKKLPSETVLGIGYTLAKVQAEGKKQNQDLIQWQLPVQKEGKLNKFDGYDESKSYWQYLVLVVSKND